MKSETYLLFIAVGLSFAAFAGISKNLNPAPELEARESTSPVNGEATIRIDNDKMGMVIP